MAPPEPCPQVSSFLPVMSDLSARLLGASTCERLASELEIDERWVRARIAGAQRFELGRARSAFAAVGRGDRPHALARRRRDAALVGDPRLAARPRDLLGILLARAGARRDPGKVGWSTAGRDALAQPSAR